MTQYLLPALLTAFTTLCLVALTAIAIYLIGKASITTIADDEEDE